MIIIFCGIPGCGKTTIARLVAERLGRAGAVELLSSDELTSPVYPKILRALARERKLGTFVLLDATFYKEEWRRQVKASAADEDLITVYLVCPVEIAVQRNRERQPKVSERVIHIMSRRMEPPERPTITIHTSQVTADQAAEEIFNLVQSRIAQRACSEGC
jgi:predicted kinase